MKQIGQAGSEAGEADMVEIEFYGIPRVRAGIGSVAVEALTLGDACRELAVRLPGLASDCLDRDRLRAGYLACINGREFTTDPRRTLADGDCVMILSADVGG